MRLDALTWHLAEDLNRRNISLDSKANVQSELGHVGSIWVSQQIRFSKSGPARFLSETALEINKFPNQACLKGC